MSDEVIRTRLTKGEVLERVRFGDFWPPDAVAQTQVFLMDEYDEATMPPLMLNRDARGELWLIGWRNELHPTGMSLLEAVRGYGMTEEDRSWVMRTPALASPALRLSPEVMLHREVSLRGLRA